MINLDQFAVIFTLSTINLYIIYWLFFQTKPYVWLVHETIFITIIVLLYIWTIIYIYNILF
jgi:hypothetical protein